VELTDYVLLTQKIKITRLQFVLECGTGMSTLVIAQAMMDYCFELYGDDLKLISMEHNKDWCDQQLSIVPESFKSFVQITYTPLDLYHFHLLG
jgi:hypothetical protein